LIRVGEGRGGSPFSRARAAAPPGRAAGRGAQGAEGRRSDNPSGSRRRADSSRGSCRRSRRARRPCLLRQEVVLPGQGGADMEPLDDAAVERSQRTRSRAQRRARSKESKPIFDEIVSWCQTYKPPSRRRLRSARRSATCPTTRTPSAFLVDAAIPTGVPAGACIFVPGVGRVKPEKTDTLRRVGPVD
jgi:hypothetical protein